MANLEWLQVEGWWAQTRVCNFVLVAYGGKDCCYRVTCSVTCNDVTPYACVEVLSEHGFSDIEAAKAAAVKALRRYLGDCLDVIGWLALDPHRKHL